MGFFIETLVNYSFIGMLYNVIKYSPIYNHIESMNLEGMFILFYTAFSFIDLNNIGYCTAGISDDVISSFKITLLNKLTASIM